MKNWRQEEKGFSLLEVLISIFIIALVAGPFISLFIYAIHDYQGARERTKVMYIAQGLLESLFRQEAEPSGTGQAFQEHPQLPQYEYLIRVIPCQGISLKEIQLEIREKNQPDRVVSLVTMWARRKINEAAIR